MKGLYFVLVCLLISFTAFLIWRQKLLNKLKKEIDEMAAFAAEVKQRLLEEGLKEQYLSKSDEELDNELTNLEYRIKMMKYPQDKDGIIEADQRRIILHEVLEERKQQ